MIKSLVKEIQKNTPVNNLKILPKDKNVAWQ
jgi:hypothetical protein